jgi:hypothetical protein
MFFGFSGLPPSKIADHPGVGRNPSIGPDRFQSRGYPLWQLRDQAPVVNVYPQIIMPAAKP